MPWTWEQRKEILRIRMASLVRKLGNACEECGSVLGLSIDHVDGQKGYIARRLSWHQRILRYEKEHAAGVRLRVLCRDCNSVKHPLLCDCPLCMRSVLGGTACDDAPF